MNSSVAKERLRCAGWLVPASLLVAIVGGSPAHATQSSDTFTTSVRVFVGCIISAADLDFGTVALITGTETTTARVDVECTGDAPFSLSFSPTRNLSNYVGTMLNGTRAITYRAQLGRRVGRRADTFTITGTLPPQPTPLPGTYVDDRMIYVDW